MRIVDPARLKEHVQVDGSRRSMDARLPPVIIMAALRHLDETSYDDEVPVTVLGRTDTMTPDNAGAFKERMAAARRAFVDGETVTDPMGSATFTRLLEKAIGVFAIAGRAGGVDHANDLDRVREKLADYKSFEPPPADLLELARLHDEARSILGFASPPLVPGTERLTADGVQGLHGVPLSADEVKADLLSMGARLSRWTRDGNPDIHFVSIRDDVTGLPTAVVVMDRIWIADVVTPIRWYPESESNRGKQMYDIDPFVGSLPTAERAVADVARARKGGAILIGRPGRTLEDGTYEGSGVTFTLQGGRLHSIDDQPAVAYDNGRSEWRTHGVLDRRFAAALIRGRGEASLRDRFPFLDSPLDLDRSFVIGLPLKDVWNGFSAESYRNGRLHSSTGPALHGGVDGLAAYLRDGRLHRSGDQPAVVNDVGLEIHADGGAVHREAGFAVTIPGDMQATLLDGRYVPVGDGPTVISSDGTQTWMNNGWPYRTDGPTTVRADGTEEWWTGKGFDMVTKPATTRLENDMVTEGRELRIRDLVTQEIVRRVDVTGKSDREVEKVEAGMLRRVDLERYYVDDSSLDEEPDAPEPDDAPTHSSSAPRP